jgi:hypothetical protein
MTLLHTARFVLLALLLGAVLLFVYAARDRT